MTESIGIRQLRQEASKHVQAVTEGRSVLVTDRGVPVARLVPISPLEARLAALVAESGCVAPSRPRRRLSDDMRLAGPPLSALVDEGRAERGALGA